MATYIIIQARMTSTRLPRKICMPLAGKRVLEVLLQRLKEYKDSIIIATTDNGTEEPIVNIAQDNGIKYYRGSEDNVLQRYYLSAKEYGAVSGDTIVRITSDCPLYSVDILKGCLAKYNSEKIDYLYADIHNSFPRGFDTEVFSFDLLEKAYNEATEDFEKEHVTPYIKSLENITISSYNDIEDNSHYRLTLDTVQDYEAIGEVYKKLNNNINATYKQIIDVVRQNPYIKEINSEIEQKSYTSKS
jgi:spore coat polysaccharide biosynthesis protein SpsF